MKKLTCNPISFPYRYQFIKDKSNGKTSLAREAADPSMIFFHGKYYIFPSMTKGFLVSEDMVDWDFIPMHDALPVYDYAPDIRQIDDEIFFCASSHDEICDFYHTKDPENKPFKKIKGTFSFWDPNLFQDDDGRIYLYWGCSNTQPLYGVELEKDTMIPKTDPYPLFGENTEENGYERNGENHMSPKQSPILTSLKENFAKQMDMSVDDLPSVETLVEQMDSEYKDIIKGMIHNKPFIEGAWMTKHKDTYYLQYAAPAAEVNVYNDGVYTAKNPLGPYKPAQNNPFSYFPGGFIPGAGHGSTMQDAHGNWWHTATMRITVNQHFERRIGIWPAGFDKDGELFCNTRYGDWPHEMKDNQSDPWEEPEYMLLSYHAKTKASSEEKPAKNAVDENVRTLWKAKTANPGEWIEIDLGQNKTIGAVHINFGDDFGTVSLPDSIPDRLENDRELRYIDDNIQTTRWKLEVSKDGNTYRTVADKWDANTDLPHDLVTFDEDIQARYVRLEIRETPYNAKPCVSGLRVFGKGDGKTPEKTKTIHAKRLDDVSMNVSWDGNATGYQILWGHSADKLYHSHMVFGKTEQTIRALVKGTHYYVRVDAFNDNGITHGDSIELQ